LVFADRQGAIRIGEGSENRVHKQMAGHFAHGFQNCGSGDIPPCNFEDNHPLSVSGECGFFGTVRYGTSGKEETNKQQQG